MPARAKKGIAKKGIVGLFALIQATLAAAAWESVVLPEGFAWESSLSEAAGRAQRENKAVIVYYTRTNCPPCDLLRARLRSSEEMKALYGQNYIFTVVWGSSMSRAEREEYRSRFDVRGAPTWVVFSPQGQYVCTLHGGVWPQDGGEQMHQRLQALIREQGSAAQPSPRPCRAPANG